ncbi:hypothetical protein B0A48_16801 [Cryoendolithus antarcticus]|uniref:Uncharacterized protein n=1 Tax=Cryoendolithus antarcticus TaxID=1507870 RepID=A0A1V8SDX4_9PEZI|nr:hypothetical protein B0A48_16801 [Cryoendolithus antarcticus]
MGKLLLPAIIAMLLCCVNSAQAISTFSPNCTLPAANITRALYVSAPNVRGTLEILWTSVATIIACTYSVLHLNVPRQRDGRRADWKDDLKWSIKDSATKALWFLKVLFAPEVYLLNALQQYRAAKRLQRKLHSLDDGVYDGRQWSLGECFYVNMGGYAVSLREDAKPRQARQLWAKSFIYLLTREPSLVLPKLLNHAELADRSKRDVFTRSIILLQISFFVATLVSREDETQRERNCLIVQEMIPGTSQSQRTYWPQRWTGPDTIDFPRK